MKRAAIYLRVSTAKGQTVDNQRLELEKVAAARGWTVVAIYEDAGISGAKGREKQPGLDAVMGLRQRMYGGAAVPQSDGVNSGVRTGRPHASSRDSHGAFCRD